MQAIIVPIRQHLYSGLNNIYKINKGYIGGKENLIPIYHNKSQWSLRTTLTFLLLIIYAMLII